MRKTLMIIKVTYKHFVNLLFNLLKVCLRVSEVNFKFTAEPGRQGVSLVLLLGLGLLLFVLGPVVHQVGEECDDSDVVGAHEANELLD